MRPWAPPLVAAAVGCAIFAVAAANGGGLELIWLPGVLPASVWPRSRATLRNCLRRAGVLDGGRTRK